MPAWVGGNRGWTFTSIENRSIIRTQFGTQTMASISTQALKQTLADVLRRVGLGEWFTVLRHGRPVARMGPPDAPGLHVGAAYDEDRRIEPAGRRLSKGAYASVLADDRGGEEA